MKTLSDIALELQAYDPQALSAGSVRAFLSRLVNPVSDIETAPLQQALDRVLAQDLISPLNVPPHDNSAMDGYAFDGSALTAGQPLELQVVGTALAGAAYRSPVGAGQAVRIMTGAIMPDGLDTVAPQELVQIDGQRLRVPADALRRGDNRRRRGEDLEMGRAALQKGEQITPAALGLIASLGMMSVRVWRRLKVAYFSTGDEIMSLGEAPREGAVYDSNRYTVLGLLRRMGCEVLDLGVVRDEPAALEAAFVRAACQADAIITSGGVSVGEADHTKRIMATLGDVAFWRIAMRPGRPMAVGQILREKLASSPYYERAESYQIKTDSESTAVLFGLPGNPVAVMVTFLAFVRPALLQMMGSRAREPVLLQARSAEVMRKRPGRTEYQRGIVSRTADGSLQVRSTGNQGSGVLSSMVQANGLIVLHHDQSTVAVGDTVEVMMFDGVM